MIPSLAAKLGPKHSLVSRSTRGGQWERAQDVVWSALVREGMGRSDDALCKVIERYYPRHAKYVQREGARRLGHDHDAHEEAKVRAKRGIWDGVLRWQPLDPKAASLSTYLRYWIGRRIDPRTRGEARIGAVKDEKGIWHGSAASLDSVGVRQQSEEGFVPHAARVQDGGTKQSPKAAAVADQETRAAVLDVQRALADMPTGDRDLAVRYLIEHESITSLAKDYDMTTSDLKAKLEDIRAHLTRALSSYAA